MLQLICENVIALVKYRCIIFNYMTILDDNTLHINNNSNNKTTFYIKGVFDDTQVYHRSSETKKWG